MDSEMKTHIVIWKVLLSLGPSVTAELGDTTP